MKKHTESKAKRIHKPFLLLQQKRSKECATFEYSNTFYDSEGTVTGICFFKVSFIKEAK